MNSKHLVIGYTVLFAAAVVGLIPAVCSAEPAGLYDASTSKGEILTPAPPRKPRINGPRVYGARPDKKFVYRIPCQGERPIRFALENLPAGLKLDAERGIITGMTPAEKGNYTIRITATNGHGRAARVFKLVVGEKLGLTPPTGWNSWGGHMINVSDAVIRQAADVFVERGLADVGFRYIGIDDCWMRTSPEMYAHRTPQTIKKHSSFNYKGVIGKVRDADGNIVPNTKFPDMKAMTDYVHRYGLKAGIYSSPGPVTCQNFAGSHEHEQQDAAQYARWGFDLLKYDQCSAGRVIAQLKRADSSFTPDRFWNVMAQALRAQDRDIFFNLCQYGKDDPWAWAPGIGIQSWRIGGDLNHHVDHYFQQALRIAVDLRAYSKPGQWNDPDFMYIHRIKDVWKMGEPSEEIPLDTNQRYQYVTLWSIICAPFFFSCDIENIDDFTISLLGNAEVVNINQDESGHVAEVIRNDDQTETVMVKKLADGSRVLAVFNRRAQEDAVIEVRWHEIGLGGKQVVRDVWRQRELGILDGSIRVKLSPNGVGLFVIRAGK